MVIFKIFKKIVKGFLLFILFVIAIIVLSIGYVQIRGRMPDAYYLKNTTFLYDTLVRKARYDRDTDINPVDNFKEYPFYGVSFHRLKQANSGVMLILRFYRPNPLLLIDADGYTKISITLSDLKNETIDLASRADVRALFSKGGSAWPEDGCYGYIKSGTLVVELENQKVRMSVKGRVDCEQKKNEHVDIDETHVLSEMDFSDLNPWLGSIGDHPYAETMKR